MADYFAVDSLFYKTVFQKSKMIFGTVGEKEKEKDKTSRRRASFVLLNLAKRAKGADRAANRLIRGQFANRPVSVSSMLSSGRCLQSLSCPVVISFGEPYSKFLFLVSL